MEINDKKDLQELRRKLLLRSSKKDLQKFDRVWEFAKEAHEGQKRATGDPYVIHGLNTAMILFQWGLDTVSIMAGLLHDTIEDAGVKREEIEKEFGKDIAVIVAGVTKVSHIRLRGSVEDEFVENLRKMFLAMAKDLRVVLVKLADRLHNMRTLYALPQDKQERIARETLQIYAPLAERLGMGEVKGELEDLAFPYLYKSDYMRVKKISSEHDKKIESGIEKMKRKILKELAEEKIRATVQARKKHLYSLWKKLEREGIDWNFEKIYDIVAFRILVDKVWQCYTALGVVHALYKPVPYIGVSDFIAQPKPNGYRSIHTKVLGSNGRIVEIQIRTKEMHEEAEFGIAAHWAYSSAKSQGAGEQELEKRGIKADSKKLSWVKQLAKWQKEIVDSKEFLEVVRFDTLKHRIFVFSPKGDVFDLPQDATPVDFAYAVHSGLGSFIKSVKVNGKMVSLDNKLKSGDIVEIIKTKNPRIVNKDWLKFVVTTLARREIQRDLKKLEK